MDINTNTLVSITEANQNFSKVTRLVDEHGVAIILKHNTPRYVIMEYSQYQKEEKSDDEKIEKIAERLIKKYHKAFVELAK